MVYLLPNNYLTRNGIEYTTVQSNRGFCIGSLSLLGGFFHSLICSAFIDYSASEFRAHVDDCTINGCGVALAVSSSVPEADFPDGLIALMPLELFDSFDNINVAKLVPPERLFSCPGVARMGIESAGGLSVIAIYLPGNTRLTFRTTNGGKNNVQY